MRLIELDGWLKAVARFVIGLGLMYAAASKIPCSPNNNLHSSHWGWKYVALRTGTSPVYQNRSSVKQHMGFPKVLESIHCKLFLHCITYARIMFRLHQLIWSSSTRIQRCVKMDFLPRPLVIAYLACIARHGLLNARKQISKTKRYWMLVFWQG